MNRPTEPAPHDSFIIRVDGKASPCEDCGGRLFHKLPPREGLDRYACNGCGAAYTLRGAEPPKLLEN